MITFLEFSIALRMNCIYSVKKKMSMSSSCRVSDIMNQYVFLC